MEPTEGDPLLSLGLIDPRGNAVPTSDWSGPDDNPPGDSSSQTPTAPASSGASGQTTGQTNVDWDSPQNPYRPDPVRQSQAQYQQTVEQLQREVPTAIAVLTAQGYNQQAAEAMVSSLYQAGIANARSNSDRMAMLPYAKRATAEQIAAKVSTSNVVIDPKELVNEPTVEAMQARANTIVAERRDRVVAQRSSNGADRVERTGASSTINYDGLSPHSMISLGLRRGQ